MSAGLHWDLPRFHVRIVALAMAVSFCAGAEEKGQLDVSPALFTVMAAIHAAGYGAGADSPAAHPLRAAVRKAIEAKHLTSLADLQAFFAAHRQKDNAAELNQYLSFALTVDGPPDFAYRLKPSELPPDVVPLEGFDLLLAKFYKEANIDQLWKQSQPAFEQILGFYHEPVAKALLEANVYLRNPTSGVTGRNFQVYVDLLGAPEETQSRSYKDDYFVVLTPMLRPPNEAILQSRDQQVEAVRHAYLHYLLDPLAIRNAAAVWEKKPLEDFAQGAGALESVYKNDFPLLVTECLIKAVEIRLAHVATPKREAMVNDAVRDGFILTAYFAERLPTYEKQEQAMRIYHRELVTGIDLKHETKRLDAVEFATVRTERRPHYVAPAARAQSAGEKAMEAAESLSQKRELGPAKAAFQAVLQNPVEGSLHARAYFGLARIAALEKDPALAEKFFDKTLRMNPDTDTKSWAHYYLGRLADAAGEHEEAAKQYRSVLEIADAPAKAKGEAAKGLEGTLGHKPPTP